MKRDTHIHTHKHTTFLVTAGFVYFNSVIGDKKMYW